MKYLEGKRNEKKLQAANNNIPKPRRKTVRTVHLYYRLSLSVTPFPIICPSLLGSLLSSLALSVCPAVKAYITVTLGWILMKLGESVGT